MDFDIFTFTTQPVSAIVIKHFKSHLSLILTILIGVTLVFYNKLGRSYLRRALKINSIHGPLAIPFIVTADLLWTPYEGIFEKFNEYSRKFPGCFKLWMVQEPMVVVHSKENVKRILGSSDQLGKPDIFNTVMSIVFGDRQGLVIADVDKWKIHRKILTPGLNGRILQDFLDIVNEDSLKFCRVIRREILTKFKDRKGEHTEMSKIPIDMRQMFHNLFMGMVVESVVGVRADYLQGSLDAPFTMDESEHMKDMMLARWVNPLLRSKWIWNLHPQGRMSQEIRGRAFAWYMKSIAERRAQLKKEDEEEKDDNSNKKRFRLAIMDTLLELSKDPRNGITDEYMSYEMNTFVLGGHDTTAETMSIITYMLALHPHLQEKVYQETLDVFGDDIDRPATFDDLSRLTYMEQFIRETHRMYPVVPILMRSTGVDVVLEEGYTVPAGSTVFVWAPGLHRDPRVFPNPETFDPEHFSEEACKNIDQHSFVPYSGGLRNCIGKRLSVILLKVSLARMLLHYRLVGADPNDAKDVRWLPRIILGPTKRIQYYLEERKQKLRRF